MSSSDPLGTTTVAFWRLLSVGRAPREAGSGTRIPAPEESDALSPRVGWGPGLLTGNNFHALFFFISNVQLLPCPTGLPITDWCSSGSHIDTQDLLWGPR